MILYFLALVAGMVLPLAFAPFSMYSLAVISPALLFFLWFRAERMRTVFVYGLLFGIGLFGVGVSWVYISIHNFGHAPMLASDVITALFVLLMALYIAVQGVVTKYLARQHRYIFCLLLAPVLWVGFEWLRAAFPFHGFPWLFLGYSQTSQALSGLAPIVGVYGISWLLAFTAGALVSIAFGLRGKWMWWLVLLVVVLWGVGASLKHKLWTTLQAKPVQVSLIQGDIAQSLKWDPNKAQQTLNSYRQLTNLHWNSPIIVWPEAAIPETPQQIPTYIKSLDKAAKAHHSSVIAGLIQEQEGYYYNAVKVWGNGEGDYLKRHLVPFGEYYPHAALLRPLLNLMNIPMSDLTPGPSYQTPLHAGKVIIAPFICYEIAYSDLVLDSAAHTNLLMTVSDDAWFGDSIARPQHLQMAQMRSLETGRAQLFGSNNGITAVISPLGQIIKTIPSNQVAVLTAQVPLVTGKTPLMIMSYWPLVGLLLLMLLAGIIVLFIKKY